MNAGVYRYTFSQAILLVEVESTFLLAVWGTEALHGETQVRLNGAHFLDAAKRVCVIDATTSVGRDLNRLFAGYLAREFGHRAFSTERLPRSVHRRARKRGGSRHVRTQ